MTSSTKLLSVRVKYADYEPIDEDIKTWHKLGEYHRKALGWLTPTQLVSFWRKPLKIFTYDLLNKEAAENSAASIRYQLL